MLPSWGDPRSLGANGLHAADLLEAGRLALIRTAILDRGSHLLPVPEGDVVRAVVPSELPEPRVGRGRRAPPLRRLRLPRFALIAALRDQAPPRWPSPITRASRRSQGERDAAAPTLTRRSASG